MLETVRKFRVQAAEADLSDVAAVPALFDQAEAALGPVQVLVNNAAYWEPDTFLPQGTELSNKELFSDRLPTFAAASFDRMFAVNTRAAALMIAEFARRHIARSASWGALSREHRRGSAVPVGGDLRRNQVCPGKLHAKCRNRTRQVRRDSERCIVRTCADRVGLT